MLELLRRVANWWHCIRYGLPVRVYSYWNVPMQGVPAFMQNGSTKYVDCNTAGCLAIVLSCISGTACTTVCISFIGCSRSRLTERVEREGKTRTCCFDQSDILLFTSNDKVSSNSNILLIIHYFPTSLIAPTWLTFRCSLAIALQWSRYRRCIRHQRWNSCPIIK